MGKEHASRHIPYRKDAGVARALVLVDFDEPLLILPDAGVLESQVRTIRDTPDGHKHAVVQLLFLLRADFQDHLDLLPGGRHLHDLRLDADLPEQLPRPLRHRSCEIRVGTRKYRIESLDNHDAAPERCVDGAELHADIPSPDHEEIFRNLFNFQGLGRCHDPGIPQIERGGDGRL